jgi:hypothetical protein
LIRLAWLLLGADFVRKRWRWLAWTPGLALDYASALQRVVHPPPVARLTLTRASPGAGIDAAA